MSTSLLIAIVVAVIIIAVYYYYCRVNGKDKDISDPDGDITSDPVNGDMFVLREKDSDKQLAVQFPPADGNMEMLPVVTVDKDNEQLYSTMFALWRREGNAISSDFGNMTKDTDNKLVVAFGQEPTLIEWGGSSIKIHGKEYVAIREGISITNPLMNQTDDIAVVRKELQDAMA